MKQCPSCQQTYPNDYAVCPRDSTELLDVSLWREGTIIKGKYRILGKLGEGGMGAVYKALHLRFNEIRALKVMNADLARKAGFVERFEREAVVARRLKHPNAVRVDDIDEAEDGSPFIVMEFVEGRSLSDLIRSEAPLPWSQVCSIVTGVAAALDAAHQLGMVHRDIKPDNIVLVEGPGCGQAKVLDFGIAKLKQDAAEVGAGAFRTATGTVLGTPQYMSPEQAKGMPGDQLDGRSDLYSLGIVMYEMLTGALPFKADTTAAWILAHLQTAPTPVTTVSGHLQIPASLASLVMQLLEKDRERRPASGAALVAAIQQAEEKEATPTGVAELLGTRVVPREEEPSEGARQQPLPRPTTTAAPASMPSPLRWNARIVIALLAFLALVGGIAYFSSRSANINKPPAAPTTQPTLIESMARVWGLFGKGLMVEGTLQFWAATKPHPNPIGELRDALQLQPQKGELHFYLAFLLWITQKQQPQAIKEFREGLRLKPEDPVAHFWLGELLQDDNDRLTEFNEAIRLKPDFATAYLARGGLLLRKGDMKRAIADMRMAMQLDPKHAWSYAHAFLANLAIKGDRNGAIALAREAARADPTDPDVHSYLASLLKEMGDIKGAIAESRNAVRLKPTDPDMRSGLARLLSKVGDIDGAIAESTKAVRLKPGDGEEHDALADYLRQKGDLDEALAQEREAIRLKPDNGDYHMGAASILDRKGDLDGAIGELREAIRLTPDDNLAHTMLGVDLLARGDLDEAIAELREAIHLQPDYPSTHSALASALRKKGNESEAAQQEAIARELSSKARGQKGKPGS